MRLPLFVSVARRWLHAEPRKRTGARLAFVTVALWARGRGLPLGARPFAVAPTAPNGIPVRLLLWDYIDVLVAREVFLDADYRFPEGLEPAEIVDLGANAGIAARYLSALFPSARIVAAEPDPRNLARLRANVAGLAQVRVVEAAVAPQAGTADFVVAAEGWASALGDGGPADGTIQVTCVTLDSLLPAGKAGLLKVDIEGGEWPLLEAGALQAASDCIVGEAHYDGHDEGDLRRLLADFDVTVHKQGHGVASFTAVRRA